RAARFTLRREGSAGVSTAASGDHAASKASNLTCEAHLRDSSGFGSIFNVPEHDLYKPLFMIEFDCPNCRRHLTFKAPLSSPLQFAFSGMCMWLLFWGLRKYPTKPRSQSQRKGSRDQ